MEMETCNCKCHPPTSYMEVCRVCCVRTAKDESFQLMMKQNQTILDLQKIVDAAVDLVKWHGAGAIQGERYMKLFSLAGNYYLEHKEKICEEKFALRGCKKQTGHHGRHRSDDGFEWAMP